MKLNTPVKAGKVTPPMAKPGTGAKIQAIPGKKVKAVITVAVLLLSGIRGKIARKVEVHQTADGHTYLKPLQDNKGLLLKDAEFGELRKDSVLIGKRDVLRNLGAYVNGKLKGAKGILMSPTDFQKRSGACSLHWNVDKDSVPGRYIGNPTQKGMIAVMNDGFYWQIEQDSNPNNKHERGAVLPVKKEKLAVIA